MLRRKWRHHPAAGFFDHRIPFPAVDALALPFVGDAAAELAGISALRLGHRNSAFTNEART
jgi:hypothetical protein